MILLLPRPLKQKWKAQLSTLPDAESTAVVMLRGDAEDKKLILEAIKLSADKKIILLSPFPIRDIKKLPRAGELISISGVRTLVGIDHISVEAVRKLMAS